MTRQPDSDAATDSAHESHAAPGIFGNAVSRRKVTNAHVLRVLAVTAAVTVLGLPLGIVWQFSTPRVKLIHVEGGWGLAEENPEQYMAADGVFSLLGIGAGIIVAVIVWVALRRYRGPLMLTGLVVGSVLCQTVAWRFGRIGREEYQAALDSVPVGWSVWRAPDLLMTDFNIVEAWRGLAARDFTAMMDHLSLGVLATMALAAAFTYTICAGWSRWPSLIPAKDFVVEPHVPATSCEPVDQEPQPTSDQPVHGDQHR